MLTTYGRQIATVPFENKSIQAEVKSSFASIKNKISFAALKVLVGNERIPAESIVYVRADMFRAEWAMKLYELGDMQFILVPEDHVMMVQSPAYKVEKGVES